MIQLRNGKDKSLKTVISEADVLSAIAYNEENCVREEDKEIKILFWSFRTCSFKSVMNYGIRIDFRPRGAAPIFVNYKEDKETRDADLASIANVKIESHLAWN